MVTIEPIGRKHLDAVQSLASHPSIGAMSNVPSPYPSDGATRWFGAVAERVHAGTSEVFAIILEGSPAGVISLNGITPEEDRAEVDFWVGVPFQGRGAATAAVTLAISHGWSRGFKSLYSSCLVLNLRSSRVLERVGFSETRRIVLEAGKFRGSELRLFSLVRA